MIDRNKRIVLLLTLFTIVFTILGGTFAYFRWSSSTEQNTEVTFTLNSGFSCSGDVGGNINENETLLSPTNCTDLSKVIRREITLNTASSLSTESIYFDLWLDVIKMDSGLSNTDNFRYTLSTSDSCINDLVTLGNFKGTTTGSRINLLENKLFTGTMSTKYYLYIWLDITEKKTETMGQKFELTFGGECDNNPVTGSFVINEALADYQLIRASVVNPVNNINAYQVTKTEEEPTEWVMLSESEVGSSYNLNYIAEEVGTYYVWFKDTENNVIKKSVIVEAINTNKPVCTWGEFNPNTVSSGDSSTITLTCTADNLADITLSTSDITLSNSNVTLTSVLRESINNGYKYTFVVTGTDENGSTNLTLPANKVSTIYELYNDSVTSNNITVNNKVNITYISDGNISGGITIDNLVTNGDFENGINNWNIVNSTPAVIHSTDGINNTSFVRITPQATHKWISSSTYQIPSNNIVYNYAYYRKSGGGNTVLTSYDTSLTKGFAYYLFDTDNYAWTKVTKLGSNITDYTNFNTLIYGAASSYVDGMYTDWDNVMTIDLTATFGSGNEPTKEWLDKNLPYIDETGSIYTKEENIGSSFTSLPISTREGYIFDGWYTGENGTGTKITEDSIVPEVETTYYAYWVDNSVPVGSISTTSTLKATKQTATLSCQDTVGVTSYYFGTKQTPVASDYTSVTSTTNMSLTKDITTSGTYYLYCKDSTGNVSSRVSKTYYTYKVNNMLQNITGSTYTTTDYTKVTNYTYLAPSGTSLTIASICKIPTGSSAARLYYYSVGEPSTTAATTIAKATAPTLSANSVYTMWFSRNLIYIKYKTNGGKVTPTTKKADNTETYTWSTDSNGYITKSINGGTATSNLSSYRYGITSIDLPNYNNSAYLNITRTGYNAVSGAQWICESGCTTANKTFSHSAITLSSSNDMCNASSKDCTIVLKVNWIDNIAPTGSISTSISSSTVTAKLTASDSGSGVKASYGWSMSTSSTCNSSVSFTTTTNSTYTFTLNSAGTKYVCARVGDNLGNVGYISATVVGSYNNYTTASGYSTFTAPASGYYQLEVWGAQGGTGMVNGVSKNEGGYGGYSTGVVKLSIGEKLYVYVGGKGGDAQDQAAGGTAGYNGGAQGGTDGNVASGGNEPGGGSGGATHIAKVTGLLSSISYTTNKAKVLIVAGGGGGGAYYAAGGHAGGYQGNQGNDSATIIATQTSGNAFGLGGAGKTFNGGTGAGGGGWYGAGAGTADSNSGGGGSGYIGNPLLISYGGVTKSMYCCSCTPSSNADTLTYSVSTTEVSATATSKYAKSGDGAAKITFIGNISSETVEISVASNLKIKVNAYINNSVSSYCVNSSSTSTSGCSWISQTSNLFTTSSAYTSGNTYYVHIKDSLGNIYHSNSVRMVDILLNEGSFTFIADDTSVATPYEFIQEDEDNYQIRFLTTGTVTFDKDTDIEVFLVGGGGGAGRGASSWSMGNGGGGGYNTLAEFSPVEGENYKITIGAGGAACTATPGVGSRGGTTSAFGFKAEGGYGGGYEGNDVCQAGGNGGSGGGGRGGTGGSNGSDGTGDCAGTGDGVNSYEFREILSGILYGGGGAGRGCTNCGGAGGGGNAGQTGGTNTGGGGGGTITYAGTGGAGGSGIVIIRNAR